jgi:uncharacterized membrane-anchored protein YhcB (DUF1043 family)
MHFFVKLILSLEKLVKNPVSWFSQKSWLFRTTLVMLLIPIISMISIVSYQQYALLDQENSQDNCQISSQELSDLRQDLEKFHNFQIEELAHLGKDIAQLKQQSLYASSEDLSLDEAEIGAVLGTEDSQVEENLRQRLQDATLTATDNTAWVYINTDYKQVTVFSKASDSSEKITIIEPGFFYPALEEKNGWQQIELVDGQLGWIENKYIIKFPINENN